MDFVAFGFAILGFLLALAVWMRSARQQREAAAEQERLEEELAKAKKIGRLAETKAKQADEQLRTREKALAEAVARRDEKAMAHALWELELERSYRQWRDVIVPLESSPNPKEVNAGQ